MTEIYAPTLFVGLGGSGARVLGWLRKMVHGDGDPNESIPIVFRAIDFDELDLNSDEPHLHWQEFQFFPPAPIANCIRAIHNRVLVGSDDDWKPAFESILDWYPDVEGKTIRFAQVEAAGARQWRPVGRVGFSLHDKEIMQVINDGMADLNARAGSVLHAQSKIVVYLVASIAGGTGSGILLDVAARIRHHHPGVAVRAVLLLPDFFKHVDLGGKVLANAYATLWELAYVKNQHVIIDARYLRELPSDPRRNVPPLQRVYVAGPYIGDRQPFTSPRDAYRHIAEMLKVLTTETLRANRMSQQTNVDADGSVPIDDPASRDLFCSFSAASIRLLTYKDLSRLIALRLTLEATGKEDPKLFDILKPRPEPKDVDRIVQAIDRLAGVHEANNRLSDEQIETIVEQFVEKIRPPHWTAESLADFATKLRHFCGDAAPGSRMTDAPESAELLEPSCARFREELREELAMIRGLKESNPRAALQIVTRILDHVRRRLELKRVPPMDALGDFHTWLEGRWKWMLALPLLRYIRVRRLRDHAIASLRRYLATERGPLFEQAIRNTAVAELQVLRDEIEKAWSDAENFHAEIQLAVPDEKFVNTRNYDRVAISTADADVVMTVDRELEQIRDKTAKDALCLAILKAFRSTYVMRAHDSNAADKLAPEIERLFREKPGNDFDCLSPLDSYGKNMVVALIRKCSTPTFEIGRTESLKRNRSVRAVIPNRFPRQEAFEKFLKTVCNSVLRATYQSTSVRNDERVLILVEDLFHPAEEIAGIYDYYADYIRRPRPELFHSDRRFLSLLPPLLSATGARGRLYCGNEGCRYDISGVARRALLCPECRRPIRTRCGNERCAEDTLASHPRLDEVINGGRCPFCRAPLRTYWWHCPRHQRRIPMDKPHCPHCVHEGRDPERRPEGIEHFVCPGCTSAAMPHPFRVEGELADVCRRGINGQKSAVLASELAAALGGGTDCPRCGCRLVPACPLGGTVHQHYLHRVGEQSPWRCYTHPSERFLTCQRCGMARRPGDAACDRCGSALEECRFCTAFRNTLIPVAAATLLCPICGLPRGEPLYGPAAEPEGKGRFCANVYTCPAGRSLEATRFPDDVDRCVFCGEEVMPLYMCAYHVSSCSVCRHAFPTLVMTAQPARTDQATCPMCGMAFATTAALSELERLAAARTVRILVENADDDDASRVIFESAIPDPAVAREALRQFPLRVTDRNRRRQIVRRVEPILARFQTWGIGAAFPDGASSDGAPPIDTAPMPRVSVEDLLAPAKILSLGAERDVVAWVDLLFAHHVSRERFDAALGGAASAAVNDITRKRLEHICERARARFAELQSES